MPVYNSCPLILQSPRRRACSCVTIVNGEKNTRLMLKRVTIENYRSCLRTSIDLHPHLSVLIGPNGSGKTNILQAIMFLKKMANGSDHRSSLRGGISVTSQLKATFQQGPTQLRLGASIDAYADESNNDVMVDSKQKWVLDAPGRKHFSLKAPLSVIGGAGTYSMHRSLFGSSEREYYRYMHARFGLRSMPTRSQRWIWRALRSVAGYCSGIRYYGASQFTNPGTCPASFEIDREGNRLGLIRSRGHMRILYNMYMAYRDR